MGVDLNWGLEQPKGNPMLAALQAFQVGQQNAQQKQTRQALSTYATDPNGAISALIAAGDIPTASALGSLTVAQQQRQRLDAARNDLSAALSPDPAPAPAAPVQPDPVADHLTTSVATIDALKQVPADQRPLFVQAHTPELVAHGFTQDQIASADLSDAGLDAMRQQATDALAQRVSVPAAPATPQPAPVAAPSDASTDAPVQPKSLIDLSSPKVQRALLSYQMAGGDIAPFVSMAHLNDPELMAAPKGGSIIDKRTGRVVYSSPDDPKYQTIKNADGTTSIVQIGGDGKPAASPAGVPAPPGGKATGQWQDFDRRFLAPHEGGYTASDGNGAPANFGINQKANPDLDVAKLTPQQAQQILHDRYWKPSGADQLPPGLAEIQGDTAINMGVGAAHRLYAESGGDPQKYLDLRAQRYRAIAAADPSKAASLPVWLQRNEDLRHYISTDPAASASSDDSTPAGAKVIATGNPSTPGGGLSDQSKDYVAHQYMMTGQLPPLGMGKEAAKDRQDIINRAAKIEAETGATGQDAVVRHLAIKSAGAALTTVSRTRNIAEPAEQTVLKNSDFLLTLAPKGGGQTNIPVLNRWLQAGRQNLAGDPDVSAFNNTIGTVADEYAKVMTGGTGGTPSSDSSRAEAYRRLSASSSPAQLRSNLAAMKVEMANRIQSLKDQESGLQATIRNGGVAPAPAPAPAMTSGGPLPASVGHTPAQLRAAQQFRGTKALAGSQENPVMPANQDEFSHIRAGSWYIDSDGQIERKKY